MQKNILVIGDIMLDKYSYGEVKRLNPESPAPLINIQREEYRLGGASNVAANISSLNGNCDIVGIVGDDENAKLMDKLCNNKNIFLKEIIANNFQTIVKQRIIENTYNQQLLRIDYEDFKNFSYDTENVLEIINSGKYTFVVISDYNKGIITKELIKKIKKLAKEKNIKLLVDAKPKNYELFKDFYLIKPNFKEFCEMIGKEIENNDKEIEKYGIEFVKEMNTNLVITRGKSGASLITKDGKYYHLETEAKKVFDVSGAGDTFIASIVYALLNDYDLIKAVEIANKASGIVVGKLGTAVIKKDELFNKDKKCK